MLVLLETALLSGALCISSVDLQTDWSAGPGTPGPLSEWGASFDNATGAAWLSQPGQLALASMPLATPLMHEIDLSFQGCYCNRTGDVNGDGLNDIVATSNTGNEIRCWLADGQGGWIESTVSNLAGVLCCDLADIDENGTIDILATSYTPGSARIFYNLGGATPQWEEKVLSDQIHGGHDVMAVDVDQDGDLDVVAAAAEDDLLLWWRNEGGSPIQWTGLPIATVGYPCRFDVADVDGDGNQDVVTAGYDSDLIEVWFGSGGSNPTWTRQVASSPVNGAHGAAVCDVDGDGDQDIIGCALNGGTVFWIRNDGGSPITWVRCNIDSFPGCGCCEIGDIDGDGDQDVFCGSFATAGIAWWENGDFGSSWVKHQLGTGMGTFPLARPGDVDTDGDLDVVCSGYSLNRLLWYEVTSFQAVGLLESPVLDTGAQPQYASIDWDALVPPSTVLTVQFRSSDNPSSMGGWSPDYSSPAELSGSVHRYFQYRINLCSTQPDVSPVLEEFRLGWDPEGVSGGGSGGLLLLVPNPSSGYLAASVSHPDGGAVQLTVFDLHGRIVAHSTALIEGEGSVSFDSGPLPPGLFFVSAIHSSGGMARASAVVL